MKITIQTILILSLIVFLQFAVSAQDKRIEEIRRIVKQTDELITKYNRKTAKEKNNADTEIFLSEFEVNKKETPYPAVGIYRKTIEFYYTYGDREENPYPNRLLKINVTTWRSARVESSDFYFDGKENLIFHLKVPEMESMDTSDESRIYFANGKHIRFLVGKDDITNRTFRGMETIVQEVLDEAENLKKIFKLSVKE